MTKIEWDTTGTYEYGVDRGVLYIPDTGVAWAGLTNVEEVVTDGDVTSYYFDGQKTLVVVGDENFGLHVEAYWYPEEFEVVRYRFGFSYRTLFPGGYRIHLVYNVSAVPSGHIYTTESDSKTPTDFAWDFSTIPTDVPFSKPAAHLIVDSTQANPEALAQLENLLYGFGDDDPILPTAAEVVAIFTEFATLIVIDHGDGTWTATGPDEAFEFPDADSFEITWPSVIYTSSDTYNISSL